MKPSLIYLLLLSMVLIGLMSCADSTLTSSDPDPQDTIPEHPIDSVPGQHLDTTVFMSLKVGNRWKYRTYQIDSTGSIVRTTYDSTTIDSMVSIRGRWWYRTHPDSYAINLDSGIWFLTDPMGYAAYEYSKYPNVVGDTFIADTFGSVGRSIYPVVDFVTVVSKGVEITVPAGTFHCTCYSYDTRFFDGTTYEHESFIAYCAPGVGLIQSFYTGYRPDGKRYLWAKRELVELELK